MNFTPHRAVTPLPLPPTQLSLTSVPKFKFAKYSEYRKTEQTRMLVTQESINQQLPFKWYLYGSYLP